jgi:flagellar assembly protein FliH
MSSKAHRLVHALHVTRFDWAGDGRAPASPADRLHDREMPAERRLSAVREPEVDRAAIERDAFAKGYAQGERAGAEAAATRGEAMVRRLAQTIEELGALRTDMMHKSERQLVQLAIAIAGRVIQREITMDRELLVAMARVALDRLGDVSTATIRLHPEDFAATTAARNGVLSTELVRVVADPIVNRGGCLVESDFGLIDLSVSAQVGEIAHALLGADDALAFEDVQVRIAS